VWDFIIEGTDTQLERTESINMLLQLV